MNASSAPAMAASAPVARPAARRPRLTLLGLYTCLVCVFLAGPIVVVFLSSLSSAEYVSFPPVGLSARWYVETFRNAEFFDSLLISLKIAAVVAVLAGAIGVLAALALNRLVFRGRDVLNALFLSPLVVPGIVLGAAVLQLYANTGVASSTPTSNRPAST